MIPAVHQVQSMVVTSVAVNFPIGQDAHILTPVAVLYRPGPHAVQTLKPVALEKNPDPHDAQSAAEPSPLAYFPVPHSVQVVEALLGL